MASAGYNLALCCVNNIDSLTEYGSYAECPHCGLIAHGEQEIEELFGFRYDGTMPRSWCRSCRGSGNSSNAYEDERISVYDAADIWVSNGEDDDYMFGYSEDELRRALR